jgi:hypothetical protein
VFTDPFSVTYNGTAYSLPRTGMTGLESFYRTADGTLALNVRNSTGRDGSRLAVIELQRRVPDPTPTDVFDPYRDIVNGFSIGLRTDVTLSSASTDIPLLRTALLALVDSTLQGRLIGGEK